MAIFSYILISLFVLLSVEAAPSFYTLNLSQINSNLRTTEAQTNKGSLSLITFFCFENVYGK